MSAILSSNSLLAALTYCTGNQRSHISVTKLTFHHLMLSALWFFTKNVEKLILPFIFKIEHSVSAVISYVLCPRLGQIYTWNGINLKIPHWRFDLHRRMHFIVWDGSKLYCLLWKYWVSINPGIGGMGSNMHFHYCPLTGDQSEPAIVSYLSCSVAFKVPY
jgi:hypothetical protein